MYPQAQKINDLLLSAHSVVIVQADNPDSDSLGSALAMESILENMGKQTSLYCGVDIPNYLQYLDGWDRVSTELPKQFDLSIIVDASTLTLFEKLIASGQKQWLATKPCIVIDHHQVVENPITFATETINDSKRASAGELIYILANELQWPMDVATQSYLLSSILGDTQGLSNQLASSDTYRYVAAMIDSGVDRGALEEKRREYSKMPQAIYTYKAKLISQTQFTENGAIASVLIPQVDINQYSPLYNPGPLIQGDMLQVEGVKVAIVFKRYDDDKVTAAIRCNAGSGIAAELAERFGGGGHAFASGFKQLNVLDFDNLRSDCLKTAQELLDNSEEGD